MQREPVYFVTVEWTVEPATIDIDHVCEYVWNTETLQYEPVSDRLEIGEGKTADVELTITSFSTAPVSYEIRYTDNPADALTTEAEEDSGGELPFPGGESLSLMQERVESAFRRLCESSPDETVAVVAHGGTIMAIMSRFAKPAQPYYFFQVGNGEGFVLETDGSWRRL